MRIRNKWRTDKPRSVDENSTAAAYIIWQIGLHFTKNLHQQEFDFESDRQRTSVIAEYLLFLSHISDRYAYRQLGRRQREAFMTNLVARVGGQYQKNMEQVLGAGGYRSAFLALANIRFDEYAGTDFDGMLPGYAARRKLGNEIQNIMGTTQTNKWVIQQVIDIDSLDAAEQLLEGIAPLLTGAE